MSILLKHVILSVIVIVSIISCGDSEDSTDIPNQIWVELIDCMSAVTDGYDLVEPDVVWNDTEFGDICGDVPGRLGCYDYFTNRVVIREEYQFKNGETEFDFEVREGIIRHEDTHAVLYQIHGDLGHHSGWFIEKQCL